MMLPSWPPFSCPCQYLPIKVPMLPNFSIDSPSYVKVATCPPGAQGACLDIVSAYRNSQLLPAHKPYVVSMWHNSIYIDHCTMEGLSSACNIQGSPADA